MKKGNWKEQRNRLSKEIVIGGLGLACLIGLGKIISIGDKSNLEGLIESKAIKYTTPKEEIKYQSNELKDEFTILAENLGIPKYELRDLHKYFEAYNKNIKPLVE